MCFSDKVTNYKEKAHFYIRSAVKAAGLEAYTLQLMLDWLLNTAESTPMDTNILMINVTTDSVCTSAFTRERLFEAASQGDTTQLDGLLNYLLVNNKRLTSSEFTDDVTGKTVLLKALLNLKDGRNDTIDVFLDIAEKTGDLKNLINASYKDVCYKGQTALHVAIERRSFDHVKLLVQKGADVQAKASGTFFQRDAGLGFYFGELPLPLAACTNQSNIVSFLMENPYRRADLTDKDSYGNTVLHTLVAENLPENTEMFVKMYDEILIQYTKLNKPRQVNLEEIENNQGLTPVKLAAKMGKIGLLRHILQREFVDEEMMPLCRKITEWVYGPVHSSLYDTSSIDTSEDNSVLDIIVFGSESPNRPEMLQIEPLYSLLKDKWDRFASKLFWMNFLLYLIYLVIFTTVTYYRREGEPPFPIENITDDSLRLIAEIITVLGAVWFLYKSITSFIRNPPSFTSLYTDGVFDILFFLQATLLLICTILYVTGRREYVGLLVLSLALAWINVLYYSRGSKHMGIYAVMMQRMFLGDLLTFLSVYVVLLVGFSAALVTLMADSISALQAYEDNDNDGRSAGVPTFGEMPTYDDLRFTVLELFKFTIGMGNLEFTDYMQYKEVFYILLISYIVLTYILLLNMLIALMGNTVDRISRENINIWDLQRASTILDIERGLPKFLKSRLFSNDFRTVRVKSENNENRTFFRVQEMNWKNWRSGLTVIHEEDPGNHMMQPHSRSPGKLWERIRVRHHQPHPSSVL
ncbi:transient receptor potential cation channel subfamily V member 1-like [Solea senegalensis]|uniref:Transient receptor potential cation channel subfamily V member 1-like n=1 Tax=Solea senegalensis TaxID=28829 RepID=A0AAV6PE61_SOLSE|nr:transient receptor potential cation channel subfamily V member 1-like [Solea senegalensis]